MKIIAKDLKKHLRRKDLSVKEFCSLVNHYQDKAASSLSPLTPEAVYSYFAGVTPQRDRMYVMAAVLGIPMKKLFVVENDNLKEEEVKSILSNEL